MVGVSPCSSSFSGATALTELFVNGDRHRTEPTLRALSDLALFAGYKAVTLYNSNPQSKSELENEIFHRFYPRACAHALRYVRKPDQAESVASEAMEKAFRKIGTFDDVRGSPERWVLTITSNTALDHLRRERARSRRALSFDTLEEAAGDNVHPAAPDPEPVDMMIRDESRRSLDLSISRLPETYRRTADLWRQGLKHQEIADEENIPIGTVKSRRFKLVALLAEMASDGELPVPGKLDIK